MIAVLLVLSVTVVATALNSRLVSLKQALLLHIFELTDAASRIAITYSFWQHRKKMQSLLNHHVKQLTDDQRKVLRHHSLSCASYTVVAALVSLFVVVHHVLVKKGISLGHIIEDLFMFAVRSNDWFLVSIFVYSFFVKVISMTEANFFSLVDKQISQTSVKKLILERRNTVAVREQMLQSFSFIPCLWFANVFLQTSATIVSIFDMKHYPTLIPLLFHALTLFYLIFLCESCASQTERETDQLITRMVANDASEANASFVAELEKKPTVTFDAWSLFTIRRQTILSFVSALTTFTVLFVQVSHQVAA